jgi:WD repeat and SOF domain-containing protein 1
VTSTLFTSDANFIVTGSDDGQMRIWKAKASSRLGVVNARERAAMEYREKLVERWEVDKGVNKVLRYCLLQIVPGQF